MSAARSILLGQVTLAALVLGSLTFGAAQALAGVPRAACGSNGTCSTRPYDQACADRCEELLPEFNGMHICQHDPEGPDICCTCVY